MLQTPLPPDFDASAAILHADGSLTLGNGMKLIHQAIKNHRFAQGVVDVTCKADGSSQVIIRFDDGRRRSFRFNGTSWHELPEDLIRRSLHRCLGMLKTVSWTPKRLAACLVGGLAILGLAAWVILSPDSPRDTNEVVKSAVDPVKQRSPEQAAASEASVTGEQKQSTTPSAQPAAAVSRKLTDEEILRSSDLTFEQKRSQIYNLAEAAGQTIAQIRDSTNYFRTCNRLSRYRVNFSPQAERAFIALLDRVGWYETRTADYCQILNARLDGIRRLEPTVYEGVRQGTIPGEIRQRYVELSSRGATSSTWRDRSTYINDLQSRIVRWSVSAQDLFVQLVAIRCCQRSIHTAHPVDEQTTAFLKLLSDDLLIASGFKRSPSMMDIEIENARLDALAYQRLAEAFPEGTRVAKEKMGLDVRQRVLEAQAKARKLEVERGGVLPMEVVLPPSERDLLLTQLAEDAGILEDALGELLLDYPWPWEVDTIKPEGKLYELTSRPAP